MPFAGVLSPTASPDDRIKRSAVEAGELVRAARMLGQMIVMTSGSWDLLHVGHAQYLETAKSHGTFLVVGVDSDAKIKERKGPHRPMVGEEERLRMLAHLRSVDLVVLKGVDDPKWELLAAVRPDVLIISETSEHKAEAVEGMRAHCGELVMLSAQSERGTTARLRLMLLNGMSEFADGIARAIPDILNDTLVRIGQKKKE